MAGEGPGSTRARMLALFDALAATGRFHVSLNHQNGRYWVTVKTWGDAENLKKLADLTEDFKNMGGEIKVEVHP